MKKIEDLTLPEKKKQWDHEPQWFDSPDLELSGPFWSVIVQKSLIDPAQYDLILSCAQGESIYENVSTDLEIAKNKATLLYNQVLRDLKEAHSENEPN